MAHLPAGDEDEEDYDSEDSGDSEFEEDFLPRSSVVIEEINDEAILAAKGAGGIMVSAANTEVSLPEALSQLLCQDEHSQGRNWQGEGVGSRHRGKHGDPACCLVDQLHSDAGSSSHPLAVRGPGR